MPLLPGKSKAAFQQNVKTEMKANPDKRSQNLAIAYAMQKRAKKMASGGMPEARAMKAQLAQEPAPPKHTYAQGGPVMTDAGYQKMGPGKTSFKPVDDQTNLDLAHQSAAPKQTSHTEDDRMLNQHGAMEEGPDGACYAEGGQITDNYADTEDGDGLVDRIMAMRQKVYTTDLNQHGDDEEGPTGTMYAEGGEANARAMQEEHEEVGPDAGSGSVGSFNSDNYADTEDGDGTDMVGTIMRQRQQMFSEGGKVANEDHGHNDEDLAGFSPNEFDDLSLRDDLESSYTGANSGDEDGDPAEDKRRDEMVTEIMKKRAKQRNPTPA